MSATGNGDNGGGSNGNGPLYDLLWQQNGIEDANEDSDQNSSDQNGSNQNGSNKKSGNKNGVQNGKKPDAPVPEPALGKHQMADPEDYQLRMGHGWTINDGTFDHVPIGKRRRADVPYPAYINHTYRSMNGLATLQHASNAPIAMCAMDTACDHVWKCLPAAARDELLVPPPNGPALWGDDDKLRDDMYARMERPVFLDTKTGTEYRFFADVKMRPWTVWPIYVEDRWGKDYLLVLWYAEATEERPAYFDQVKTYSIIDPRRDPVKNKNDRHGPIIARRDRIIRILQDFYTRGNFDISDAVYRDINCAPMDLDEHSSGERCFAHLKIIISRIAERVVRGSKGLTTYAQDLPRWIHPYQHRVEMAGINAWVLMATMNYNARITVESLTPNHILELAVDGEKRFVYNFDLAGAFHEPPVGEKDYQLPFVPAPAPSPPKSKPPGGSKKKSTSSQ